MMKASRREFLRLAAATPAAVALAVFETERVEAQGAPPPAPGLSPTRSCGDGAPTPRQTEGPYFKPESPARTSLVEPGMRGTRIVVAGTVLSTGCQPVPRALVDFWQADDRGAYDNAGYKLRGHQFTDETGHYSLTTVVPGLYPGRTRHLHVKVQAPNQLILTTQLYFPGESSNVTDGLFKPHLLMTVQDTADGKAAMFNFVLESQPRRTRARSGQG